MYKNTILLTVLSLITIALFVSCENAGPVGGIEEIEFQLQPDLRIVDGGENTSMAVERADDSYFKLKLSDTGSNKHLQVGNRSGWILNPDAEISDNSTLQGITLYSTYGEDYWVRVNYLLNEGESLKENDADITYREIQAALWGLLDFTGFDPESPDAATLPDGMVENGDFLFNIEKVREIVKLVESNAHTFSFDPENIYGLIAKSDELGEFMLIENSAFAFDLVNLNETHNMVVAWDLNDQGQIVGGNKFLDAENGILEMGGIFGRAVNSSGQVAGNSGSGAAYWDAASGVIAMESVGGDESEANAINESGQVVGEVVTKTLLYEDEIFGDEYEYEFRSFIWSGSDGSKKIGSDGWATGINSAGEVVGTDQTVTNRGFIWDAENEMSSLGSYYGFSSARPNAINNNRQVVGSVLVSQETDGNIAIFTGSANKELSKTLDDIELALKKAGAGNTYDYFHVMEMMQNSTFEREAFPWRGDLNISKPINLSELDQKIRGKLSASAINNTRSEAFIWTQVDGMKNLGTLGGNWSTAWDVNDNGQVVGYSDIGEGQSRAFVWDEENGMVELPTLGGNSLARAINNEGEIVGYSYDSNGNFYPVKWTVSIKKAS